MAVVTASSVMAIGKTSHISRMKAQLSSSSYKASSSLKPKDEASDLEFLSSQFCGIRISSDQIGLVKPISAPLLCPFQPIAHRICPFTGKKSNNKNLVSHSNHKTKKLQFVNLQYKRLWWEEGKWYVKLRMSTKAIKTIEKNGLDAMAKKAGIDLSKITKK